MHLAPPVYHLLALNRFKVYDLNIENTYGKPLQQMQAIALSANGNQIGVYRSVRNGWQDTLLANKVLWTLVMLEWRLYCLRNMGLSSTLTKMVLTLSLVYEL